MRILKQLLRCRKGATAIEYGLIAALIAVVTIAGLSLVGTNLNATFGNIATKIGSG